MSREDHLKLGATAQRFDPLVSDFSMVAQDEKHSPPADVQSSVQDPTGPEDEPRTKMYDRRREFEHASLNFLADSTNPFTTVSNTTSSRLLSEATVPQRPLGDGRNQRGFTEPDGRDQKGFEEPDETSNVGDFSTSIDSYFEDHETFQNPTGPSGNMPYAEAPPATSTISTTISPSQVVTFRVTSPSLQSGPREGINLDKMSNSDLANYLDDHGASVETLDLIVRERWSGNEWVSTFCPEISQCSAQDIWNMLRISSLILKTRLMTDIRETLRSRQEFEVERKMKLDAKAQAERERREIEFETAKAVALASIIATKPQELSIKNPRAVARVEHAPRIPDHMHQPGSGHGDTFQIFCNTLTAWIAPHSQLLEAAVRSASQGATEAELAQEISRFGQNDRELDSRLVAQLYSQASVDLRSKLYEADTRQIGTQCTTVKLILSILQIVEFASYETKSRMLSDWMSRSAVTDPAKLIGSVERFVREVQTLRRLGLLAKGDAAANGLMIVTMSKMISKLETDPARVSDLATPICWTRMSHPDDAQALLDAIYKCALNIQSKVVSDAANNSRGMSRPGQNRLSNGAHSNAAVPKRETICFSYRETNKCSGGDKCHFKHTGRTGNRCEDKQYLETGMCSKFRDCLQCHPWDVGKFGAPEAFKFTDDPKQGSAIAAKRAVVAAYGKSFMVHSIDDEMAIQEINEPQALARYPLQRPGRGVRTVTDIDIQRYQALVEDIEDDEMHAAIYDTDLSDVSVTQTSSFQVTECDSNVTMTDGLATEGDVTESDESEALFSHSDGSAEDGSYGTESEMSSESIDSDADLDSSETVIDWNACLSERGWSVENISAWEKEQGELERAMIRRKACNRSCQITGAIDYDSGTCPNVLMMLDGGTFTHMIGNNAMHLACNLRQITPYPIKTAGGIVWLSSAGDLVVKNYVFRNCLVNPHLELTLLSEGWLTLVGGWTFHSDQAGKLITDAAGRTELAYTRGVLTYLPASYLPEFEVSMLAAEVEHKCSIEFQESIMNLSDLDASRAWQYFSGGAVDGDEPIVVVDEAKDKGDASKIKKFLRDAENVVPLLGASELDKLETMVSGPKETVDKAASEEMYRHQAGGHRSKLILNVSCQVCWRAGMAKKGAFRSSEIKDRDLHTVNTDTVDMIHASQSGRRYLHNLIVVGTQYGEARASRNKDSVSTARAFRDMKCRLEALTDPGGIDGYKIQCIHHDPGSEFSGAMKTEIQASSLVDERGEVDRHTDGALIENRNKMIQRTATALSIQAFDGVHSDFDALTIAAWDEIAETASELLNHSCITSKQKELGMTAIEEQTKGRIKSSNILEKLCIVGEGILVFVPKDERASKHSARAIKAIYVGSDRDTPGAIRVMPYFVEGGRWHLGSAIVSKTWRHLKGTFPLRLSVEDNVLREVHEAAIKEWRESSAAGDSLEYGCAGECDIPSSGSEFEPECIINHHDENDDDRSYEIKWVGFGMDDTTWHLASDIPHCDRLISEYWERVESANAGFCGAVEEVPWSEWLNEVHAQESKAAMEKELNAMTVKVFPGASEPRLVKLSKEEIDVLNGRDLKTCLKGRYSNTIKRDGRHKSRIVAQDLKKFGRAEAKDVYAPTPGFISLRFMLAAAPRSKYNISTTDFDTAYLQGNGHQEGDRKLFKLWDGSTKSWTLYWLTGYIYGEQPAGKNWKDTLSGKLESESMGFVESKNAPSMYYNPSSKTRVSVHVDDPIVVSLKPLPGEPDTQAEFYTRLKERFDIKGVTELQGDTTIDYLSMTIGTCPDGNTTLCNPEFVDQLVSKAGLNSCNPAKTAITKDLLREIAAEAELGSFVSAEDKTKFQSIMGDINWLAQTTHPDVMVAASLLGKRSANPTVSCMKAAKHVVRYLAGRRAHGFVYGDGDGTGLVVWSDSDCAGTYAIDGELRSRMGISIRFNGYLIGWISKHITGIMVSSGEAEIFALSEAIRQALHLKYIGEEIGLEMPSKIPIMVDAAAALAFAENTMGVGRMKHLDLRTAWIQEMKNCGKIQLIKVDGVANDADFFTKILPAGEFRDAANSMTQVITKVKSRAAPGDIQARGHGEVESPIKTPSARYEIDISVNS